LERVDANSATLALESAKPLLSIMSEQTWFEIVGTRLQDQSKDKRSVRLIVAVDNIDDEKKERSLYDCKLRAGDLIIVALPDFRPEPHEVTFKPEKIEKPDDDKLIALAGVPTFRDGNVYELRN
jgi:hypothetical protein